MLQLWVSLLLIFSVGLSMDQMLCMGCKVVLVSDCPNISDVHVNLSRSNMSASGQLPVGSILNISCYLRMSALILTLMSTTLSIMSLFKE